MFYCARMAFNLADLLEIVTDAVPDRLALVAGDRRLTYAELDERGNRLARHLAARGVEPGDRVAILAWNRAEWVEAMIAAYKIRAVPVNVNYRYTATEIHYVVDNSDAVAIVYEPEFAASVDEIAPSLPGLRHCLEIGPDYERALAGESPARDFAPRSPEDLYLLYTGGTTGVPKGVVWRQEDIFFAALGGGGFGRPPITTPEELATRVAPLESRMVPMVTAPMMHGGGQWVSYINWFGGGTVVLWTGHHFDASAVWRLVEREGCNTVMVVGDAMARPLAEALAAPGAEYDTSGVAVVGSGGAILSPAVKEQLRKHLPNGLVVDSFGASETGAGGSVDDAGGPPAGSRFTMGEFMTVLGDDLRPVAAGSGAVGKLARRGHIPLGYWKDDAKTAATFAVDPDGVRWVLPGDAARIEADGTITLLGRGSECINTGGEKVYPEEVEAALKAHADVFDAVVVGVADDRFVERVAAVVEPRPGATVTLEQLREHCARTLAGYKAPRELVVVPAIPRTPVGKPDYPRARALAERRVS
jgi:acyl-CoA synthetase (AMP-forming)/AMP-acid ligase II